MYDINDLDELLDFYGGRDAAEEKFGSSRTCFVNWKKRGIPNGWHGPMICDLVEAGKTFDPTLFDVEGHPGARRINQMIEKGGRKSAA